VSSDKFADRAIIKMQIYCKQALWKMYLNGNRRRRRRLPFEARRIGSETSSFELVLVHVMFQFGFGVATRNAFSITFITEMHFIKFLCAFAGSWRLACRL